VALIYLLLENEYNDYVIEYIYMHIFFMFFYDIDFSLYMWKHIRGCRQVFYITLEFFFN